MNTKSYIGAPKNLGQFEVSAQEYFSYTYLPIKLVGQADLTYEPRLRIFDKIFGRAACDFIGQYGLDRYVNSFVYVTAKHARQREGQGFNRPGWHSDGFMTEDISYIWSNRQPTVFSDSIFELSQDDILSMQEMEEQANPMHEYSLANESLLRLDETVIHKTGEYLAGDRAFCKIVISKDKFDLKGNSINYLLPYEWEYRERATHRNIPQKLVDRSVPG